MTNIKQAYTPRKIVDSGLFFSIPLYQRLFEWGEEQIIQLLDDLYSSYKKDKESPYHIGMLTVKRAESSIELVDGQQRFTAMILLGIHYKWNDFLYLSTGSNNILRLQFTAREEDKKYIEAKIKGIKCSFSNEKMEKGLNYISTHLNKILQNDSKKDFEKYIFNNLTFFLSELPEKYSPMELNTYFERMNTSGKSLENYEILKVDIIRRLHSDKEKYTHLWNACSIMEKMILRKHNNEQLDSLRNRYKNAMIEIIQNGNIDNAFEKYQTRFDIEEADDSDDNEDFETTPKAIGEIEINTENPYKIVKRRTDEHSLLTFPEFLLQVLYICLKSDISKHEEGGTTVEGRLITDFFDVRKLCDTFEWAFDKRGLEAETFMRNLGLYRLITDYFIIRMNDEDEEPYPFKLYKGEDKEKMKVRMYLAMLYSASSAMTYYMWMPKLLTYLECFVSTNKSLDIDAAEYLAKLKEIDNEWHPEHDVVDKNLTYGTIDRYWFWRIDYYLWEQRELFFKKELLNVVEKYVFRRNRSIEHIAPQHPKDEFGDKDRFYWDDESRPEVAMKRDCLGNMVMISSGQNSTLTNSCFEVKHAVMQRYASGNGTIESLKMLYVYSKYSSWSLDNIDEHQRFSMNVLKYSYERDSRGWNDFHNIMHWKL